MISLRQKCLQSSRSHTVNYSGQILVDVNDCDDHDDHRINDPDPGGTHLIAGLFRVDCSINTEMSLMEK